MPYPSASSRGRTFGASAAASLLPFSDDFARADGDLGNGWEYTAGKWTISSGSALGTPALGSNLSNNGTFDSDTAWVKGGGWSISGGVASHAATASGDLSQSVMTVGKWYQIDWDAVLSAGTFQPGYLNHYVPIESTSGSYVDTGLAGSAALLINASSTAVGTVDNITCKEITLADMFATRDLLVSDIDISVPITYNARKQVGIVMCLDSKTAPANFLAAMINYEGSRLQLFKCVAGTYTELIGANISYSAGRVLRLRKSGTTVQLFYNAAQVGTDQTVSDAGIKDNTRHGMFTTHANSTIGSFDATNP